MRARSLRAFFTAALLTAAATALAIEPQQFDSPQQEERYQELIKELRCLVCQNQNIADSNAGLASDLRDIVLEQIKAGRTDEEIKAFLLERYGEFVLYDPPVTPTTYALWYGPVALVLVGAAVMIVTLRRRASGTSRVVPDPDQEELDRQLKEEEQRRLS